MMVEYYRYAYNLHHEIQRRFPEKFSNVKQILVARLCSVSEIQSSRDALSIILQEELEKIKERLDSQQETKEQLCIDRYLLHKRMIYLPNTKATGRKKRRVHGEARLFDHDGRRRGRLGVSNPLTSAQNFLDEIKKAFREEFDDKEPFRWFLYTFNIPCTSADHNCSKLIRDYVDETTEYVAIMYSNIFKNDYNQLGTDNDAAKVSLQSSNIDLVPLMVNK